MISFFGFGMALTAVLTWAMSSIGFKYYLGSVGHEETKHRDPIAALGVRILIILIVLGIISIIFGNLPAMFGLDHATARLYWTVALMTGFLTVLGDFCYFFALRFLDTSRVYPLINTQTLFTFPLAFLIFGEAIPSLMWIAAVLVIVGVLFVGGTKDAKDRGMENIPHEQLRRNYTIGILCGIGTGFFFGTQYITMALQNRIYPDYIGMNFTRTLMYTLILWTFIAVTRRHFPKFKTAAERVHFKAYVAIGLFGAVSFGIGDILYQIGVTLNGAAISIIIASSAPIFNQVFAIAFLKEHFRPNFLIGVACIVVGNILVIF